MTQATLANNKDKLVADLKAVVSDAEDILRSTADIAGEKVATLRARVEGRLKDARARLEDVEAVLIDKTKLCARATDDFVHEQPWKAVGIAAIVGTAIGVLIGRR
ncbi:MAG: DUF883 family protein [Zoogloeaceae bacterium]|jgi:ElaB/YqjD/DUF883 family membrane-anchored ribosome-binding protein|nr:DUF883 family protein [Zoogloeaceae bacterium]